MKSSLLLLIPAALALSACGKNSEYAATPPPGEQLDSVVPHNANECPTNLNGQYTNRHDRRDRTRFAMVRRGNIWVLQRDGQSFELTGDQRFVTGGHPPRRSTMSSYVASCTHGTIVIRTFRHRFGQQKGDFDVRSTITPSQGAVRVLTQGGNAVVNSDKTYDVVRRAGPVRPGRR